MRNITIAAVTYRFIAGNNAALNGNAIQVGTYTDGVASRAVDGSVSTVSCASTFLQPWWSVDLASPKLVIGVQITSDGNAYFCTYMHRSAAQVVTFDIVRR